MNRRTFLKCTATGSAALTAPAVLARTPPPRLRIGQIGLAHPHAAGKLKAIQALKDTFELVGVVEPNAALRRRADGDVVLLKRGLVADERVLVGESCDGPGVSHGAQRDSGYSRHRRR